MRQSPQWKHWWLAAVVVLLGICGTLPAGAVNNPFDLPRWGMIWTTDVSENPVDEFVALNDVYLNGGLDNNSRPLADGWYYVQVTQDANGMIVLARTTTRVVQVVGGAFAQNYQLRSLFSTFNLSATDFYYVWIGKNRFTRPPCWPEVDRCRFRLGIPGRLSGIKWIDLRTNGIPEPDEPRGPGWTVLLYRQTGSSWTLVGTDITDNNGYYEFTDLAPGVYRVYEVLISDWTQSYPMPGPPAVVPPLEVGQGFGHEVPIVSGSNVTDLNFGNYPTGDQRGGLIAFKWYDRNCNGVFDAGEVPIAGWQITVIGPSGDPIVRPTDVNGLVLFDLLSPGIYTVIEESRTSWVATTPAQFVVPVMPNEYRRVEFGNVRLGPGGRPPSWWLDCDGIDEFYGGDGADYAVNLAAMVALNLCDDTPDTMGSYAFNPVDHLQFWYWLGDRNDNPNMAFLMSSYLAVLKLNVLNDIVEGDALVAAGPPYGFITVDQLIAIADAALAADDYTPLSDPNRNVQTTLKNILGKCNSGMHDIYVQDGP